MSRTTETVPVAGGFLLGDWLVEPSLNRVSRDGAAVQLEIKMMDVLVCLASRPGEVVSRRELIDSVWATEFVSDNALSRAIAEIRNALGDDARNPVFIETIHRRGYRLIAPMTTEDTQLEGHGAVVGFPARHEAIPEEPERSPYPGLSAFTELDAEYFFGRDSEAAGLWRKLTSRRLLAVIGPSGVGKSSFLRAGVVAAMPAGWAALVCQPGDAPFVALARALVPEYSGDDEAVARLVGLDDGDRAVPMFSRWRERHDQALLLVDQFEELFTLNPPDVQREFVAMLRRLVDEADVHVLLAMRDDFLYECHAHRPLSPIFDSLTPLAQPVGEALELALTGPAARHGYSFEDEALVEEMASAVDDARGALPLLAFAVSRLWERRDTDDRLLTRQAYQEISGVSGALALHAEATLNVIGEERLPIVRELFRNLVTAQGTRATRDTNELLSVFDEGRREEAAGVIDSLVDARLLTSFEGASAERYEHLRHHRVEVVHESLLSSWPRLVRWRAQDAESAQLRDELRQAATLWEAKDRPADRLWSGTSFREFMLWRERYPGGLTETEEAFAAAMTSLDSGRRRRRGLVATFVVLIAVSVAAVTSGLWRRSVGEARRAEASRLLALGRLELDKHPTAAVAYALASLEMADAPEARRFALEALWRGPTQIRLGESRRAFSVDFSQDGRWLAVGRAKGGVELWSRESGRPLMLEGHVGRVLGMSFGPDSEVLFSVGEGDHVVREWSVATGDLVRSLDLEGPSGFRLLPDRREVVTFTRDGDRWVVRAWPFNGGEPWIIGRRGLATSHTFHTRRIDVDPNGSWLAYGDGHTLRLIPLDKLETAPSHVVGTHDGEIFHVRFDPSGERVASADEHGGVRLWSITGGPSSPVRSLQGQRGKPMSLRFDWEGSRLAVAREDQTTYIWNLDGPPDADPLVLRAGDVLQATDVSFHPGGDWVATTDLTGVALWPLSDRYPSILRGHTGAVPGLAIAPDGEWIATSSWDRTIRVWSLFGERRASTRAVPNTLYQLAVHPSGRFLLGGDIDGGVYLIPVGEGETGRLEGFSSQVWPVAFSPNGRLAAAGGGQDVPRDAVVRVWDLGTGAVRVLDSGDGEFVGSLQFAPDGRLVVGSGDGIRLWDLEDGTSRVLRRAEAVLRSEDTVFTNVALSRDGRRLVCVSFSLDHMVSSGVVVQNLETGEERKFDSHGNRVATSRLDPTGNLVLSGDVSGVVRVGPVTGEEPHLLYGHESFLWNLGFTPEGRWIASTGDAGTLRLWPMPDMNTLPFHTLPYDELLDRLRALTNLRAVEDEKSPTGYSIEAGPFPGWETVPTW